MPNEAVRANLGLVEVIGGAVVFVAGAALEVYAGIKGSSLGGLALGSIAIFDGIRREGNNVRANVIVDPVITEPK